MSAFRFGCCYPILPRLAGQTGAKLRSCQHRFAVLHAICVLSGERVQMSLAHALPLWIRFLLGTKLSFNMANNAVLSRLTESCSVNKSVRAESLDEHHFSYSTPLHFRVSRTILVPS